VSQYQKGKTNLDFTEARDSEPAPTTQFFTSHPTNSIKAMKANQST